MHELRREGVALHRRAPHHPVPCSGTSRREEGCMTLCAIYPPGTILRPMEHESGPLHLVEAWPGSVFTVDEFPDGEDTVPPQLVAFVLDFRGDLPPGRIGGARPEVPEHAPRPGVRPPPATHPRTHARELPPHGAEGPAHGHRPGAAHRRVEGRAEDVAHSHPLGRPGAGEDRAAAVAIPTANPDKLQLLKMDEALVPEDQGGRRTGRGSPRIPRFTYPLGRLASRRYHQSSSLLPSQV